MSPAFYAADRRSAALRYTDGSAPRTVRQFGSIVAQNPIASEKRISENRTAPATAFSYLMP